MRADPPEESGSKRLKDKRKAINDKSADGICSDACL